MFGGSAGVREMVWYWTQVSVTNNCLPAIAGAAAGAGGSTS